jgi:hypothetical protein
MDDRLCDDHAERDRLAAHQGDGWCGDDFARRNELMRISTVNRPALWLTVPALLGAGCATIQRYETERLLVAAGFHMRPADTPERQEDLRSIPPHRIVSRTRDGHVVYMYADPDGCRCVYVGGDKEYSEYERLRVRTRVAPPLGGASPSGGGGQVHIVGQATERVT